MSRAHLPTTPRRPAGQSLGADRLRPRYLAAACLGTWSQAPVQTGVPRLRRLVGLSPRRREPQETTIRAWLTGRALVLPAIEQEAA